VSSLERNFNLRRYGSFGAALRVNPWDTQEVADAINEALNISQEDRDYRWKMLNNYVNSNTAQIYVETFIDGL
jgi:trehalose-6-phosphate synthase